MAEKNKHAKFLKSKKDALFEMEQFLSRGNMEIMEKSEGGGEDKSIPL